MTYHPVVAHDEKESVVVDGILNSLQVVPHYLTRLLHIPRFRSLVRVGVVSIVEKCATG